MSGSVKKLASQTLWYGVPTIVSRFLNYLLTILLVGIFKPGAFGVITNLYAFIPFLNVLFTYGLETAYFRFTQTRPQLQVYQTLLFSIIVSTIVFTLPLLYFSDAVALFLELPKHPEYIRWLAWIVFFDTLVVIPFALLRQQERPRKYAFVKMTNVMINIGCTLFFYLIAPNYSQHFLFFWYDSSVGIGYVLIANLIASGATLVMLYDEWKLFTPTFDRKLWWEVMQYSFPLLVVGFGGMINEMLSRFIFLKISPLSTAAKEHDLGVFGANYKLAVLITIFIQIFKMAAEPFFFSQSKSENAQKTYARVMKFFVMACCCMFLGVSLFTEIWQLLITYKDKSYGEGIGIVPILAMGSVFLGIYYNLSIWYKLSNQNWVGARITLIGAIITIGLNIWWIPLFGYTGSAWATFCCYLYMMVASYYLGQRHYPITYAWKKLVAYLIIAGLIYIVQRLLIFWFPWSWMPSISGFAGFFLFIWLLVITNKKDMQMLPIIGRFIR